MATTSEEISLSFLTGGFQTNYHDVGTGSPVLLIHGSGPGVSSWANWRGTIPILSQSNRVIAPDMVGFGFTEVPEGIDLSRRTWLNQLLSLLDGLGLEQVDVVGNSFGGALALSLAIEHPERVRKLVLMGSVGLHFTITEGLDKVWGYSPSLESMEELIRLFAHNKSIATPDLVKLRYQASIREGSSQAYARMFPAPRQQWLDAMAREDSEIQGIEQKTLILHGRDDRIIPLESSERLARLLPNSQLHVFGNCGHWVQIEKARDFNHIMRDFLHGDLYS